MQRFPDISAEEEGEMGGDIAEEAPSQKKKSETRCTLGGVFFGRRIFGGKWVKEEGASKG